MSPTQSASKPKSEKLCLGAKDAKALATYKLDCDVCKKDLVDTKLALEKSMNMPEAEKPFWEKPAFVIGGMAVSFSAGALLMVATKCFGGCK